MDKREFKGMAYTFCFLRGANYIPLFFAFNGRSLSDIFRGPSRELSAARCRQGRRDSAGGKVMAYPGS